MKFHPKRVLAVAAAAVVGLVPLVAGGAAQAATADNYAHSSATRYHHTSIDVAFQVRQMFSGTVNAYNQADATSKHCTGCRSVSIAFQIVTDARQPHTVNAGNYASAVNVDCVNCDTLGVAYQFVVAKPTMLSGSDMAKLWRIDGQLQALRWSYAPSGTISAEVDALAGQVSNILAHAGHGWWPQVHRYLARH